MSAYSQYYLKSLSNSLSLSNILFLLFMRAGWDIFLVSATERINSTGVIYRDDIKDMQNQIEHLLKEIGQYYLEKLKKKEMMYKWQLQRYIQLNLLSILLLLI